MEGIWPHEQDTSGLDLFLMFTNLTVVTSVPIPKYSNIQKRPIIFNNCTEDLQ